MDLGSARESFCQRTLRRQTKLFIYISRVMWKCIHIDRGGGACNSGHPSSKTQAPFRSLGLLPPHHRHCSPLGVRSECPDPSSIRRYFVSGACGMPRKLSAGGGGRRAKGKKKLWVQGLCVAHARYQGQANKCTQQSTTYSSINSSIICQDLPYDFFL